MARESDEAFTQRLLSEGVPYSKIRKELSGSSSDFPRRQIKAAPRKRASRPIDVGSENQMVRHSQQEAKRTRDGGGKRSVQSASRTSGPSVSLVRQGSKPRPAKAMGHSSGGRGTGSVGASRAGGGKPIVRSGSGGLSLRGGTRGNWRRDSKGRFA